MTRFPWAPLESLLRAQLRPELNGAGQPKSLTQRMAVVLGCDPGQIARWRRYGLLQEHAEKGALAAGVTPWTLWPDEWFEAATKACERSVCGERFVPSVRTQRYCSERCRVRENNRRYMARRYAADPDYAEDRRERRRAYYREATEYEKARERRRYHARKVA